MSQTDFPPLRDSDPRLIQLAEDVRDMGDRVMVVLGPNPGNRYYAIDKLSRAFRSAAMALIEELGVDGQELIDDVERIMERNG